MGASWASTVSCHRRASARVEAIAIVVPVPPPLPPPLGPPESPPPGPPPAPPQPGNGVVVAMVHHQRWVKVLDLSFAYYYFHILSITTQTTNNNFKITKIKTPQHETSKHRHSQFRNVKLSMIHNFKITKPQQCLVKNN